MKRKNERALTRLPVQVRCTHVGPSKTTEAFSVRCAMTGVSLHLDHCKSCPWSLGTQARPGEALVLECRAPHSAPPVATRGDLVGEFGSTPIGAIMANRVTCIDSELDLGEAGGILKEAGVHTAPVVEDGGVLLGVVSRGDLLRAPQRFGASSQTAVNHLPLDAAGLLVEDVMTVDVVRLSESASLAEAVRLFARSGAHRIPVVSGHDVVVGMVSAMDVLRWVSAHLEPIEPEGELPKR